MRVGACVSLAAAVYYDNRECVRECGTSQLSKKYEKIRFIVFKKHIMSHVAGTCEPLFNKLMFYKSSKRTEFTLTFNPVHTLQQLT